MSKISVLWVKAAIEVSLTSVIAGGTYITGNFVEGMDTTKRVIFWSGLAVAVANNIRSFTSTIFAQLQQQHTDNETKDDAKALIEAKATVTVDPAIKT